MCKSVQDSDIRVKHSIAKSLVSNHSSDHSPPRASLVRGGQPASAAMRYPTRNPARCLLTLQKGERGGTSAAFINDRHTARHNNPSCRHSPSLSSPGSRRAGRSSVEAAPSISPHTRPLISHPTLPSPPPVITQQVSARSSRPKISRRQHDAHRKHTPAISTSQGFNARQHRRAGKGELVNKPLEVVDVQHANVVTSANCRAGTEAAAKKSAVNRTLQRDTNQQQPGNASSAAITNQQAASSDGNYSGDASAQISSRVAKQPAKAKVTQPISCFIRKTSATGLINQEIGFGSSNVQGLGRVVDGGGGLAARSVPRRSGPGYTASMLKIYNAVTATGLHNVVGARIQLPSNLNFKCWENMAIGYKDAKVVDHLKYGFPANYQGIIPDPTYKNHSSALLHNQHVNNYINKEVKEGAMLGPFPVPPFAPWCQVNALLTRPKKDSNQRRVIMDLSFPHPPKQSVNAGTPSDIYMGEPMKMRLPSVHDLCRNIKAAGKGSYLFSADVARAFRQLPLDPADWPLTCLKADTGYYVDISLPFGLRWACCCCDRVTRLIVNELTKQGVNVLCYVDDFAGVAPCKKSATTAFSKLQALLDTAGLQEAKHKASPPTQVLVWLGIEFDTVEMTISIPHDKLTAIRDLVEDWKCRSHAHITQLRSLMGKLLHIAQCSAPARLFLNRMLNTLRQCPPHGNIQLSTEFRKDLAWFEAFLPTTNGIFFIDNEHGSAEHVYVDSCLSGCGGIYRKEAYHHMFPQAIRDNGHSIAHLEALNVVVAIKTWAKSLTNKTVIIHSDSATAVAVMQAGRGRDSFIQACAREVWLTAAVNNIAVSIRHVPGDSLFDTADALSRWHTGDSYKIRVDSLIANSDVCIISVPERNFILSDKL